MKIRNHAVTFTNGGTMFYEYTTKREALSNAKRMCDLHGYGIASITEY